ncbi:PH domain-containing protein [Nakamurella alba]|uniref:PH domain-containing protein n=1 Tax=Nakamurella alba TaxID=2665158 RepID=UPI0018AA8E8D|nr:PH domain-containing protein [Nakamurella alba]
MSRPDRAVFRLPLVSLAFPVLLFVCATPLATVRVWLLWVYLAPVLAVFYVLLTRTTVTPESITTSGLLGRRRIAWSDLDGFEFRGPRWAVAVTTAGKRIRLPMIRPRDLPVLAEVSGGRLNLAAPPADTDTNTDTGLETETDAPTDAFVPAQPTDTTGVTDTPVPTTPDAAPDNAVDATPDGSGTGNGGHEATAAPAADRPAGRDG